MAYKISALLSFLLLAGCSTGSMTVTRPTGVTIQTVALLPVVAPMGVRQERVALVEQLVTQELDKKGYQVLDPKLVSATCGGRDCPNRERLFSRFHTSAVVRLELTDISTSNFVLGYFDTVQGKLELTDQSGKVIEAVQQKQRQQGGLLANTGQVVQAISSQAESFRDGTFEPLARKFAHSIVDALGAPGDTSAVAPESRPNIGEVKLTRLMRGDVQVCFSGTPGQRGSLNAGRLEADFIETTPGKYCAVVPGNGSEMPAMVSLRSPLGLLSERSFMFDSSCALTSAQAHTAPAGLVKVALDDPSGTCASARKLVYRAPSPEGPFSKVSEFSGVSWTDHNPSPTYSLLVKDGGLSQVPVVFQVKPR